MRKKLYHQFACSSLMLPEHRARLARHHQDKVWESSLPPADEQQLEQFQRLIEQSMHSGRALRITFRESGRYRAFTGVALEQQPESERLRFRRGEQVLTIPTAAIVHLEIASSADY